MAPRKTGQVTLPYPIQQASYTVSAWFMLSNVEASVQTFVVSLTSDIELLLPPLRLTNASSC